LQLNSADLCKINKKTLFLQEYDSYANAEMKRKLMPYPLRERDNNPNTPADPAF
jgi:hypothetical protein